MICTMFDSGEWTVNVYYEDRETEGSPFAVGVFDPSKAKIIRATETARIREP